VSRPALGLVAPVLVAALAFTVAARWPRTTAPRPAASAAAAPAAGSEIHLVVAGGPAAGRYDVTSGEPLCTEGLLGASTWGVQYSRGWSDDGLAGLQLVVAGTAVHTAADTAADTAAAAGQDTFRGARWGRGRTTEAFRLDLAFGRLFEGVTHEVETRPGARAPRGRGVAEVLDSGGVGLFHVDARTADDVAVAVTVHCRTIRRLSMPGPRPHSPPDY
jgi:hypothetical protein